MRLQKLLLLLATLVLIPQLVVAAENKPWEKIKPDEYIGGVQVACVGDSITYGYKLKNRETDNYPKQLGALLGTKWKVQNYGVSSMTMLRKAQNNRSYWDTKEYKQVLTDKPHVIIIMLGTNDQWQRNWTVKASQVEFKKDYSDMIDSFKKLKSKPRIWLCLPIPILPETVEKNAQLKQVIELTEAIAKENKLPTIDLYTWMSGKKEMYADSLHPNAEGAKEIARKLSHTLTGKPKLKAKDESKKK